MKLSPQEVKQFYRVWFPLLHYVNQQLHLVTSFPANWNHRQPTSGPDATRLRDALWEDDSLYKRFLADNPAKLTHADLDLVQSWKDRRFGDFFILRHTKTHTIFLSDETPQRAYGVFGLMSPINAVVGSTYLPLLVKTTLLPFGTRIIYDGLISVHPVLFGQGTQSDLILSFRRARERYGIIRNLRSETDNIQSTQAALARNMKILAAFETTLQEAELSQKMIATHKTSIETFIQHLSISVLDLDIPDIELYLQEPNANPVSLKRFVAYLRDSDRIDYEKADELLKQLKQSRQRG